MYNLLILILVLILSAFKFKKNVLYQFAVIYIILRNSNYDFLEK